MDAKITGSVRGNLKVDGEYVLENFLILNMPIVAAPLIKIRKLLKK